MTMARPNARAVAPTGRRRQLDGHTARRRSPRRRIAGERDDKEVLALEEPMASNATRGPSLRRIVGVWRHLEGATLRARQCTRGAGRGDDDGVPVGIDDPEEHDPRIATERSATGRPAPAPPITPEADAELRRTAMVGPPELIVDRIRSFAELAEGRFEFHARMIAPGLPADVLRESMNRFAAEVIPFFRHCDDNRRKAADGRT